MATTERGLKAVAAVIEQDHDLDPRPLLDALRAPAPVCERAPLRQRAAVVVRPALHAVGLYVCGGAVAGALVLVSG